jgi:hypothetical protein
MSREKLNSDFKNQEEAIKSSNNKLKEKISELEVKTTELENSLDFKVNIKCPFSFSLDCKVEFQEIFSECLFERGSPVCRI